MSDLHVELAAQVRDLADEIPGLHMQGSADPEETAKNEFQALVFSGAMHAFANRIESGCQPGDLALEYVMALAKVNVALLKIIQLGTRMPDSQMTGAIEALLTDLTTATLHVDEERRKAGL